MGWREGVAVAVAVGEAGGGCSVGVQRSRNGQHQALQGLAITVIDHLLAFSCASPTLPIRCEQVIFCPAHDPREWTAHMVEAMDGQFINVQRWVSMVTDSRLGFGLYEAMPHLTKPLA